MLKYKTTPGFAHVSHPPAAPTLTTLPHPTTLLPSLSTAPFTPFLSPPPPQLLSPIPNPPPISPPTMATIISPPSPDDNHQIPTATLALPSASRRLPPPCWTPDETVALIDAYRDKWYSLRRGNLRANHWQEVAGDVAARCPASPPKTAIQCRHKMEKLRKRYRGEIQRSAARGRSTSSWAHFHSMHSMEKGPTPPPSSSDEEEDDTNKSNSVKRINDLYNHHSNHNPNGVFANQNPEPIHYGSTPGVRIKIPGGIPKLETPNPRLTNKVGVPAKTAAEGDVVGAIQAFGEGFMRMEKMKMEMARKVEDMRMQMELKRTEMILESQQRIVDAFAHALKKPRKTRDYAQAQLRT